MAGSARFVKVVSCLVVAAAIGGATLYADTYIYATTDIPPGSSVWNQAPPNGTTKIEWIGSIPIGWNFTLQHYWGGSWHLDWYEPVSRILGNAPHAVMQSDGNFVLYDANWVAKWDTGTSSNPGAFLAVQDDGNFVIYSSGGGSALWAVY